jgi:HK97 family phage prohead protease
MVGVVMEVSNINKSHKEIRMAEFKPIDSSEGKMILEGYAIVYEQPATHEHDGYKFTEIIKRGALDNTDMIDVPLRYNHNDTWCIMARTRNKSLQLIKDDIGLKIRAELIDIQSNRDIYKAIQAELIDKMSFAFTITDKGDTWTRRNDTEVIREVIAIKKLFDVSVVDTPFYDTTSVYARSLGLLENSLKQLDSFDLQRRKIKLKYKYEGDLK